MLMMKLSTILILTICQFSNAAAKLVPLESRDPSMQNNCAGSNQVTNVQIFETLNQLVVVWQPPACDIENLRVKYIVEYTTSSIATETIETEETFHYLDYTANICFDIEFTITAVMDDVPGPPYSTIYQTRFNQVTHVQTFDMPDQLVVVWQPPDCDIGDAQLKYIVMYATVNKTQTVETETTFHYFDHTANMCFDSEISITAVFNEIPGAPYNTVYNTVLGEVANIYGKHSQNNIVHIQWEAPIGSSDCELDYLITLATSNGITNITVGNKFDVDIENIYMKPCENATVTITPIRGEIVGPTLNRIIQGEIGPVRNIVIERAIDGEDIFVDFLEPENSDLCDLRYEIHNGHPGCLERNVSISVLNTFGDASHTTVVTIEEALTATVTGLNAVRPSGDLVRVSWDPLKIVENCSGSYVVTYKLAGITINSYTPQTSKNFYSCQSFSLLVAPVVNDVIGPSRSYTVRAC